MYVCGPTVYSRPHIGNGRSVVVYDMLFRLMRHVYGEECVTYVRNITDVDDKIIVAAQQNNVPIHQLTTEITRQFHEDMQALNALPPTIEPRATTHISDMIQMITSLLKSGHAYVKDDCVYFAVHKAHDYYALSSRSAEESVSGTRVEVDASKEAVEDFILWKPSEQSDPHDSSFDSPWGRGRPGWHIECSAMSTKYLGTTFDLHGGGVDLVFPHHTNEIAQSTCCFPGSKYAKTWVHNGFLTVDGAKMSKSLNNFLTVRDLIDQGVNGETIRYVYLATHYRKPLNWTSKSLYDAKKSLDLLYRIVRNHKDAIACDVALPDDTFAPLCTDLNTPKSLQSLHALANQYFSSDESRRPRVASQIMRAGSFLGLLQQDPENWMKGSVDAHAVERMIALRAEAKTQRDFAKADEIRHQLKEMGVELEDASDGQTHWRAF